MSLFRKIAMGILILSLNLFAENVLIVNGSTTTSEPSTTSEITNNLSTIITDRGDTPIISDALPLDISGYNEIWDIRFDTALSSAESAEYLSHLQNNGKLFLMGENSGFMSRNNSIIDFIQTAGGGSVTFSGVDSTQNVNAPYDNPNPVSTITYNAPGGVGAAATGNGIFMTEATSGGGSAVAYEVGTMTNAIGGRLAVVFDVNFMQGDVNSTADNIQFTKNLANFVSVGNNPPPAPQAVSVPLSPTSKSLLAMLFLLAMIFSFRLKAQKNAV
jgi:hypothetical protein